MIEVHIDGRAIKLYNEVSINLKFDAIASTFSLKCYFNPDLAADKTTFKPFSYRTITIKYGGVLVLTGTVLSHTFGSAGDPPKQWVTISGYSITGILGDSSLGIYKTAEGRTDYQYKGMTLQQIAEQLCGRFPLKVIVDKELLQDDNFTTPFPELNINPATFIGDFLNDLCSHKNVVLSHNQYGNVVLTRARVSKIKTTQASYVKAPPVGGEGQAYVESSSSSDKDRPILYSFTKPGKSADMSLTCDGQRMHRAIQVVGQQDEGNAVDEMIINPYVPGTNATDFRPGVGHWGKKFRPWLRFRKVIQKIGGPSDTIVTARALLSAELKNVNLSITVPGWTLGGNLITPNQLVVVKNPDVYCYNETKWFIQSATLNMDENKTWTVIGCALPDCFTADTPKNVFG